MSTITCPVCGEDHDDGDHPDLLAGLGSSRRTEFECCNCGARFEIDVDFEPIYYVLKNTVRKRESA